MPQELVVTDYGIVGFFFLLGIFFVGAALFFSWLLRPSDPNPVKNATYECGEIVKGNSRIQFNVSYYLVALLFVVFDIEALFLIPWAVTFRELGIVSYLEMMAFILILLVGLVYAWKKGIFKWQ